VTIIEAIKAVMLQRGSPMTAREAYDAIVSQNLYEFHAQNPAHVVQQQIRRYSEGIDFPTAESTKHFKLVGENKFLPLEQPKKTTRRGRKVKKRLPRHLGGAGSLSASYRALLELHEKYVGLLRDRLSTELRRLAPSSFEHFAKSLLEVYGFEDTHVTQVSRDGGIDGYGKLPVGLAHLNVAFQCKRWTKANIQRTEIDKFRGAAQGEYEQGIFFATTSFSPGAIGASLKRGAIPIVLIDLAQIVKLMIDKKFGVQIVDLQIPTYALDLIWQEEDGKASRSSLPSFSA
jgi:restriction system protein